MLQILFEDPKVFYKFINSLRCPLCGSQLDGKVHQSRSDLYCVGNSDEYCAIYTANSKLPVHEEVNITYDTNRYEFISTRNTDVISPYKNTISKIDLNLAPRFRQRDKIKIFENVGTKLPYFSTQMTEKELLNKIKIYNLFS
jgi:hypothetical protein